MAWIYLAALEDSASHSMNGLDQLPIAKSTPIVKESCSVVYPTDHPLMRQYGMISNRCRMMGEIGPRSTSFMEVSHARTLALLELKKAYLLSEVDCFSFSRDWLTKLNPSSYSLKMFPMSSKSVEVKSLKNLTRWGWTAVGVAFLPQVVEPRIKEIDGSCWPTITASQAGKPIRKPSLTRRLGLHGYDLQDKIGEKCPEFIGQKINVLFLEWLMGMNLNWTELEPWAMPWFLSKRKKRSKS